MLSDYWTQLLLTKRMNDSFTLKIHAGGDGLRRSEFRSSPFRTAKGFRLALEKASWFSSSCSFGLNDVSDWIDDIRELSPKLATDLQIDADDGE